jgi:hypothetical protein
MKQRIRAFPKRPSLARLFGPKPTNSLFLLTLLTLLLVSRNGYSAVTPPVPPAITFEPSALVITGVTPNTAIIVFGVECRVQGYGWATRNVYEVLQSDASGNARLDVSPRVIPPRSIYTAVDSLTGGFAVVSAQGAPLATPSAPSLTLNDSLADEVTAFDTFDLNRQWIEVICVRPGVGAWRMSVNDGSSADALPTPGAVQLEASGMHLLAGTQSSPVQFLPSDVLIVIAPYDMEVIATAVTE